MAAEVAGAIATGYGFADPGLTFGAAMHGGATLADGQVRVPLAMMTRHGLVAGATGTGKTKTLQVLAEQLSEAGVPVFISDIKGDISGLAAPAETNDKINARATAVGWAGYAPKAFPVEFLTLDRAGQGVRLRASVSSFGPILLAKVLDLSETQQSVLAMAFKYADDKRLPLVNLDDLRALLNHLNSDAGKTEMIEYGGVATATVGVIVRKIVELEQQEADAFFGAPEFDVVDFLRTTPEGAGVISDLVRGSGLAGARGMPARRGRVVRPLLGERRATLQSALDAAEIAYRIDPTNDDPAHLRNRIRHELLPLIEGLRAGAVESLARFARLAADDDALLDALAAAEMAGRRGAAGALDWRDPPDRALGRRILRLAIGDPAASAERIEALLDAAEGPRGGLRIELGDGRTAMVRGRQIRLE